MGHDKPKKHVTCTVHLFGGRGQHWGQKHCMVLGNHKDIICILQPVLTQQSVIGVKIASFTLVSLQAMKKLQGVLFYTEPYKVINLARVCLTAWINTHAAFSQVCWNHCATHHFNTGKNHELTGWTVPKDNNKQACQVIVHICTPVCFPSPLFLQLREILALYFFAATPNQVEKNHPEIQHCGHSPKRNAHDLLCYKFNL